MKKLILTLSIALIALIVVQSCKKEQISDHISIRNKLVLNHKKQNCDEIKQEYNLLSKNEKINIWIDKINQVIKQNIPKKHTVLLNSLKQELKKLKSNAGNESKIKNIAIELAKITPKKDFIQIFAKISDYKYKGFNTSENSSEFMPELKKIKINFNPSHKINKNALWDCNCRWICDLFSINPTSHCKRTDWGCGFLWLQDCTRHV